MIKSIKIGPYRFAVIKEDLNLGAQLDTYGTTIALDQKIVIDTQVKGDVLAETLLHEMLHAIWFVCQLDKSREEETIGALSPWLLLALRENPKLLQFLINSV